MIGFLSTFLKHINVNIKLFLRKHLRIYIYEQVFGQRHRQLTRQLTLLKNIYLININYCYYQLSPNKKML
jgi:hypothetical protein